MNTDVGKVAEFCCGLMAGSTMVELEKARLGPISAVQGVDGVV